MTDAHDLKRRFSRQELLEEIGTSGQQALLDAKVLVVGSGALGTNLASSMVRAGVSIRLVDRDLLEASNLHRQILFDDEDVAQGLPKALAAARKLRKIHPQVAVEERVVDLTPRNVEELIDGMDLVLDGTDNLETRYVINDACVKHGLPWVYGGAIGTSGMTMNILPGDTPCLRCVFPEPPPPGTLPTCDTVGVLNTTPAIVASLQATEAFKILLGAEEVSRELLSVELWDRTVRPMAIKRNPDCPTCGQRKFEFLEVGEVAWVSSLCGRNSVQITPAHPVEMDFGALRGRLEPVGVVDDKGFLLQLTVEDHTLLIFPDGAVIVQGTTDEALARTLYARYIGT